MGNDFFDFGEEEEENGTTFVVKFIDGTRVEIRNEQYYVKALIKAVHKYMTEINPEHTMQDLTMTEVSYWNSKDNRMEYILQNASFRLGVR